MKAQLIAKKYPEFMLFELLDCFPETRNHETKLNRQLKIKCHNGEKVAIKIEIFHKMLDN